MENVSKLQETADRLRRKFNYLLNQMATNYMICYSFHRPEQIVCSSSKKWKAYKLKNGKIIFD